MSVNTIVTYPKPKVHPDPAPIIWPQDQLNLDTSVKWVIRDFLRRGALTTVTGLPGTFKSLLMLDAAVCIANGLTEFLVSPIETNGPVLVIAADDGAYTAIDRLRMISRFRLGDDRKQNNIALIDSTAFLREDAPKVVLEKWLLECITAFDDAPALVIIDTAAMAGAPTSDFGHSYPEAMGWLKKVARDFLCSIVLVDHESKPTADRPDLDARIAGWGSIMKSGFYECGWSLRSVKGKDGQINLAVSDKRSPLRPRRVLTFGPELGCYSLEVSETTGPESFDDEIVAILGRIGGPVEKKQLVELTGKATNTVRNSLLRLEQEGAVRQENKAAGQIGAKWSLVPDSV